MWPSPSRKTRGANQSGGPALDSLAVRVLRALQEGATKKGAPCMQYFVM